MATRSQFPLLVLASLATAWLAWAAAPARSDGPGSPIRVMQETVIRIGAQSVAIDYTVTMNQAAAYLEVLKMDADGDGVLGEQEQKEYFDQIQQATARQLEVLIGGAPVPIRQVGGIELSMPFKKTYRFEVDQPAGWREGVLFEFHNDNFLEFTGPITIGLDPGTGADIEYHSLDGPPADRDSTGPDLADLEADAASCPQQRDVVLRYRAGTGRATPAGSAKPLPADGNLPSLADQPSLRPATRRRTLSVPLVSVAALLGTAAILGLARRRPAGRRTAVLLAAVGLLTLGLLPAVFPSAALGSGGADDWICVAIPLPGPARVVLPQADEARRIFRRLHRNIYNAFDAKTESEVYDVLAENLHGELLETVYNEVYDARRMRENAAADFSLRRIQVIASDVRFSDSPHEAAYRVHHRWQVHGTVTHVGHVHARLNQYDAVFTVAARNGRWRIVDVNVQQHDRLRRG